MMGLGNPSRLAKLRKGRGCPSAVALVGLSSAPFRGQGGTGNYAFHFRRRICRVGAGRLWEMEEAYRAHVRQVMDAAGWHWPEHLLMDPARGPRFLSSAAELLHELQLGTHMDEVLVLPDGVEKLGGSALDPRVQQVRVASSSLCLLPLARCTVVQAENQALPFGALCQSYVSHLIKEFSRRSRP